MNPQGRDIQNPMELVAAAVPDPRRGGSQRGNLSRAEFSARFEESRRTLWLIAAGVLGRRTDAEDVLQDAAMIGLQKITDFDPETSFQAWMGGIVRNVARNHARKNIRRQTSPTDPVTIDQSRASRNDPTAPPSMDSHGRVDRQQPDFDDSVLHALDTLEETARTCLLLRVLHEMPYREIALWLQIPEGTAMSHVHRSRQALRRQLSEASQ